MYKCKKCQANEYTKAGRAKWAQRYKYKRRGAPKLQRAKIGWCYKR